MNKLSTYFSLLVFLGFPSLILAQSPACPAVNAGANQSICPGQCVNLTATPVSGSLTTSYTVSSINYAPFNFNQGTGVTIGTDDIWSQPINLPFCFQFYGVTYNQCVFGSNGLLSFDLTRANGFNAWTIGAGIATNAEMTNSISCPYHDIDPSISGDIQYFLGGTAPCRYLVVSFAPIPMFSCTSQIATQQIVLYETTNVIDTYIQNKPLCTNWNSGAAIHGIKGANGNFTLVPGRDFPTQWTATNDARRFTPSGAPSYTIAWFQGATQIGTGATIQVCPNTTTTYTARATYTNCAGNLVVSDDVIVSTNAPSPVTIASTQVNAGCGTNNGTATATPSGGSGTYTYNWNTTPAQTTQTATGLAAGTYAVTVTASGSAGCPATATFTITQPTASPVSVSGNNSICQGAIATFTATPGLASYNWTTPTGTASGQLINASVAGTYTVTATNAQGCTATGSRTLTILPSPTVTVSNTGPYCDGAAISMTATPAGANAYNWAGPNGFTGNTATISSLVASATTAGVYNVTVTGSNTCTASGTTTVVSNPLPVPTVSSNSPVCTNAAITLTAGGGSTYSWSGPNAFSSSGSPLSIPGASASMAGIYTVTVTSSSNCTATTSTNVVVNPVPTITASNTGPYCPSTSIQLNATGGTSYNWSGPNTYTATGAAPTISNSTAAMAGTYTVTATDVNGCTNTAATVVSILPTPAVTATNTGPYCYGVNISLTATPAGATAYAWTGPNGFTSTSQSINTLVASASTGGVYNVTVTGTNGCTASASTTVVTNSLPIPTATSNSPICQDTTLTLNGGGGASYTWSGPNTFTSTLASPTISNVTLAMAGVYNVTVTNASGCTATVSTTVVINPLPTPTATNTGPYCPATTIQLNATGGTSYSWSGTNAYTATGAAPTISNATAAMDGTYTVTATDANGCTNTATTVVTILPIPAAAATNTGPYCYGLSMLLTATPAGATNYAWVGPNGFTGSGQNINVLVASATTAGTYNVTVTGTNGCTATASTTVVTNPLPVPVATSNSPICQGTTLSLSASGGNTYTWSGPNGYSSTSATPTITNTTPAMSGNYNVTVTGAGGCTATAVVSVVINASPTPVVGNTGPYCPDATIQLNASGGIDYVWTGPNGFSATGANPTIPNATTAMTGTYNVTVQDANGCTATGNTPVLVNPSPIIAPTSNSPICVGTTLNLNAGTAQAGATYAWTYGATPLGVGNTFSIPNVTSANAGVYTVGAQSAAGCTATATTTVVINPLATPTITGNTVICPNQNTTLNAGVYNAYAWSTTANTQTISPNQVGTYSVTVTDANTCTGSASVTLTANPGFSVSAGNNGPYCTGEIIDLNTNAGYASYSWSGPLSFTANTVTTTRPNATSTMSGAYTVTVTDTDGCTATASTNVTVQAQLVPTITGVPANGEICAGTTGTMNAGSGYASYIWSNSSTAQSLTVGTGGIYTVTVTDLNACTGSASFTITVNQNPIADAGVNTLICNGTSTTLAASASGGESPYTYLWDNSLGTITNPSVTPATTTSYNVTVTDNNGCTGTDMVTIDVNPALTVDAGLGQNICAGTSATLTANASGGAPAYNYTWTGSTISSNPSIVVSPAATTTYNVTLTDSHNCTATDNVTVTVIANPTPTITTTSGSTNFCYTTDITLNAGSGYAAYQWQNGNITQTRTVYNTGNYVVTVTDSNGCSGTGSITVNELQPVIISGTVTDVYCFGGSDGAIDITNTTGGVGTPYTYVWSTVPPRTTADITGIAAGNYTVTATDAFGCTGTASYTIGQPATAVQVSIISSNATCFGASNGTAIANPYGGTANYTYNWSNNLGTSASVTTLAANQVYTVTVTDARGCTVSGSVSVNQPSQIVLTPTAIVPTSCFNSTDGEATVVASGGTPGYAYQWSNGETGNNATELPGGVVQVTVSDNYGCTLVQSLTVPQPIAVSININNQTIPSCNGFGDGSITVAGNSSAPPFAYNWSVAAGSQLTATATGLSAGVYSVTVTDINGCTAARNITLGEPSPIQANLTIVNPVVCNGDATGEIVAAANGGTPAYSFLWSGGETTAVVDSLPAGTYTVTVTDSRGCTITDNIVLDQPDPLTATFTTVDALCFGANNGSISINATGGVLAYQYSIDNGASFYNGSNFAGLGADTYQIVIRDHNDCEIIDSVTVLEPADFITTLFPIDSTIEYGDVITLNTTASTPATYIWTPADSLSCDDCANPDAAPLTTTNYTVYISDANGCTDTLVSHINVIFNRRVYVPNLFTPNGDGNNDLFYVQGGRGLKEIQEFRVFDRWGELVYQQESVLPNTPGWDGQFKGKDVNSGVFVWYAKILYDDGLVELIKGDVTVLR